MHSHLRFKRNCPSNQILCRTVSPATAFIVNICHMHDCFSSLVQKRTIGDFRIDMGHGTSKWKLQWHVALDRHSESVIWSNRTVGCVSWKMRLQLTFTVRVWLKLQYANIIPNTSFCTAKADLHTATHIWHTKICANEQVFRWKCNHFMVVTVHWVGLLQLLQNLKSHLSEVPSP